MSSIIAERQSHRQFEALEDIGAPEGYRVEILGDEGIVMSPSPTGLHQHNIWEVAGQLRPHLPEGMRTEDNLEVRMHNLMRSVIPDLFVAPIETLATAEHQVAPDELLLACEVVSPNNPDHDRVRKLGIYAAAAIPAYLLVDPIMASTTLYFSPENGEYTENVTAPFGKSVEIPEPFGFELDTSRFRTY